MVAGFAACNSANQGNASPQNANQPPASAPQNVNQPAATNTSAAAPSPATTPPSSAPPTPTTPQGNPIGPDIVPQAILRGTYAISEVQQDGVVEMVSPENTTEITFKPPATFSRVSKRGGKIDHSDSGEYDIFGNNSLILKIMMSRQRPQIRPVVKRHTFSLSADGKEFRLTSEKGRIAVFRRIRELPETSQPQIP